MSIPYKCPVCDGVGAITDKAPLAHLSKWEAWQARLCSACSGAGVVWEFAASVVPWFRSDLECTQ